MLTIIISDKNAVFSSGLYIILKEYLDESSIYARLIEKKESLNYIKVFTPLSDSMVSSPKVIEIRDTYLFDEYNSEEECHIYRNDNVNDIVNKFKKALSLLSDENNLEGGVISDINDNIGLKVISSSEAEVIHYWYCGVSLTDISIILNRSIKTVSGRKRSVMKKLNLKTNRDLYLWFKKMDFNCPSKLFVM